MLSSDYLRQRALYCLQDLVTRYLTEETLQRQTQDDNTAVSAEYTSRMLTIVAEWERSNSCTVETKPVTACMNVLTA